MTGETRLRIEERRTQVLRYAELTASCDKAMERLSDADNRLLERKVRSDKLNAYMEGLDVDAPIAAFDEGLWNATVESLTVGRDGTLTFHWKDGTDTIA